MALGSAGNLLAHFLNCKPPAAFDGWHHDCPPAERPLRADRHFRAAVRPSGHSPTGDQRSSRSPRSSVVQESAMREKLPNRRPCISFSFTCNNLSYTASIGRFPDGRLAEIFLSNTRSGSHSDAAGRDSAVVCSLALQGGVSVGAIRHALLRDSRGVASSPLGVALDLLAGWQS